MSKFRAFRVHRSVSGKYSRKVEELSTDDLPEGDLLIDVHYSSLNYKDGLSATGHPGVTRNFPHTPGIDAAGVVERSNSMEFKEGEEVIVIGFGLGMNTPGGFGRRIRVPSGWAVKRPSGLTLRETMILGTAGFTAALCIRKLEAAGMSNDGPVLVTGATGGVGSVAVQLLGQRGYEVHAVTGKQDQHDYLRSLGATEIMTREEASESSSRLLHQELWGGVVDTVGGDILVNGLKALRYGRSLAACGLVNSPNINITLFPFILRNINLLGIDSVELPIERKSEIWQLLADEWRILDLERLATILTLDTLSDAVGRILKGQMVGRGLIDLNTAS